MTADQPPLRRTRREKSTANGRFFIDLTIRWHGHEYSCGVEPPRSSMRAGTSAIGAARRPHAWRRKSAIHPIEPITAGIASGGCGA